MNRPPKGSSFEYQNFERSEYMGVISHRLENEVGFYIDLINNNRHPSGAGVGFWSGVRMIMPVVETVARIEGMNITDFMGQHLRIPVPILTWAMFRHALIHNDQMQHIKYQNRTITWGLSLTLGTGHIMQTDHIHVDVKTLYEDLQTYLRSVIAQNDTSAIKVAVGFTYSQPPPAVSAELQRISN